MDDRPAECMQRIAGPVLGLEPLLAQHAFELFPLLVDPRLHAFLDEAPPVSAQALRARQQRWEARRSPDGRELWLNWLVRRKDGQAVGFVQATVLPAERSSWIAYMLTAGQQGRGYGREAAAMMCRHLQAEYGVQRLMACVEASNHRSIRLLEALRFEPAPAKDAAAAGLSASERLFLR